MSMAAQGMAADGLGRRRAALLAGRQLDPPPRLDATDVAALQRDCSPPQRAAIARKLGHAFDDMARGPEGDLARAVLDLLVGDVAREVRRNLSEALALSEAVPRDVALKLATDAIEIATPMLETSRVLTDRDLIEIVRTNTVQYALAVAGREHVSEPLADTLIDTGEREVAFKVVGNQGAVLSAATLRRVAQDHRDDRELQERLVRRPELPYDLVDQLVGAVADRLEWEIVRRRRLDPKAAAAIVAAVRERSTISLVAREHAMKTQQRRLHERFAGGELGPDQLLEFLRDGDVASFEALMALMTGLDLVRVRQLLYADDRRMLAAVCLKAGLAASHYIMIRMAIELAAASASGKKAQPNYEGDALGFLQEQYQKLKADPERLAKLLVA